VQDLGKILADWAAPVASVRGLTLFGSRARAGADSASDWDFQVITSRPAMFGDSQWARSLPGAALRLYAPRMTRFGGVPKVNMILEGAEADLVIIPAGPLRVAKLLVALGLHRREGPLRRRLRELAVAVRPGWRFLKGEREWGRFYSRVVAEVDDPRLADAEIRRLGDTFVYDYLWMQRKLARGELVAAQRTLQRELAEANLRLVHELRLRRAEPSFPEGRRAEQLMGAEAGRYAVGARCDGGELAAEAARCREVFRGLMESLVGHSWQWPAGVS
jgi:hypothetical protein